MPLLSILFYGPRWSHARPAPGQARPGQDAGEWLCTGPLGAEFRTSEQEPPMHNGSTGARKSYPELKGAFLFHNDWRLGTGVSRPRLASALSGETSSLSCTPVPAPSPARPGAISLLSGCPLPAAYLFDCSGLCGSTRYYTL